MLEAALFASGLKVLALHGPARRERFAETAAYRTNPARKRGGPREHFPG
jgi:hypothetical protein